MSWAPLPPSRSSTSAASRPRCQMAGLLVAACSTRTHTKSQCLHTLPLAASGQLQLGLLLTTTWYTATGCFVSHTRWSMLRTSHPVRTVPGGAKHVELLLRCVAVPTGQLLSPHQEQAVPRACASAISSRPTQAPALSCGRCPPGCMRSMRSLTCWEQVGR